MLRNIFKMTESKRLRMDPGPLIGTHKYFPSALGSLPIFWLISLVAIFTPTRPSPSIFSACFPPTIHPLSFEAVTQLFCPPATPSLTLAASITLLKIASTITNALLRLRFPRAQLNCLPQAWYTCTSASQS